MQVHLNFKISWRNIFSKHFLAEKNVETVLVQQKKKYDLKMENNNNASLHFNPL